MKPSNSPPERKVFLLSAADGCRDVAQRGKLSRRFLEIGKSPEPTRSRMLEIPSEDDTRSRATRASQQAPSRFTMMNRENCKNRIEGAIPKGNRSALACTHCAALRARCPIIFCGWLHGDTESACLVRKAGTGANVQTAVARPARLSG